MSFENDIKQWVAVDNQLKVLNDKMKNLRETRNVLSGNITDYAKKNNLSGSVNIGDEKLKFVDTKVQAPLTYKFLEKTLGEVIRNDIQAKLIVDQIKDKRESKTVPGQLDDKQNPFGTRNGANWVPAECDVPLRKGWFYHPEEKDKVKSPAQLFDLYLKSVGRGAALDLGIAPNTNGLLADEDIASLKGFGKMVSESFKTNLAASAKISSTATRGKDYPTKNLTDERLQTYWASKDNEHVPSIEFLWKENVTFDLIRLREYIPLGQRIESFQVDVFENNQWTKIADATSVGACRIIFLNSPVSANKVRININASPVCVTFSEIGFYKKADL